MEDLDAQLLSALSSDASSQLDTLTFCASVGATHQSVIGAAKSLEAEGYIVATQLVDESWSLTAEAEGYMARGSPEAQVFAALPVEGGLDEAGLAAAFAAAPGVLAVGKGKAMQRKWVAKDKASGRYVRACAETGVDELQQQLAAARAGSLAEDDKVLKELVKRQLLERVKVTHFLLARGAAYAPTRRRLAAELSKEMLDSGAWRSTEFKAYNFDAGGKEVGGGHLHALMKVRAEFRGILLEMGFSEMPTNRFVESSFWNFDSLFQPQVREGGKGGRGGGGSGGAG